MPTISDSTPGAIAAGLLLLAGAGCSPAPVASAMPDTMPVDIVTARPAGDPSATFDGVVRPRRDLALGFRTGGRVMAVTVQVGDHVRAGQVLARLAPGEAIADTRQAGAELAVAAIEATRADEAARRAAGLDGVGALSAAEVRDRALTAGAAAARRDAARATLDRSRMVLAQAVLVAPEDGIVTDRLVEPGTIVDAGGIVVRVAAGGPEVEVHLPERVRPGVGTMADARLWAMPGRTVAARLRLVGPAADGMLRMRTARFTLAGDPAQIPLNGSASVTLRGPATGGTLRIPLTAIDAQGRQPHVWTLSPTGERVHRRPVRVIELRGDDAIVAGLPDGQRIVAQGGDTLSDGQRVAPTGHDGGSN